MTIIFDTAADGDAPDLLNTTLKGREINRIAHDLGRGDTADLESAGLQARSNAAVNSAFETRNRKKKTEAALTALELALLDPDYSQHYHAVWQKIDDTQAALDEAILENAEYIGMLEDNALRTADGQMIFKTDDGFVYADGTVVAKQDVPSPSDASKNVTHWQDYKAATDRRDQLARIQTDTLDPIRERMSDTNNPPDKSALEDFDKRLGDIEAQLNSSDLDVLNNTASELDMMLAKLNPDYDSNAEVTDAATHSIPQDLLSP